MDNDGPYLERIFYKLSSDDIVLAKVFFSKFYLRNLFHIKISKKVKRLRIIKRNKKANYFKYLAQQTISPFFMFWVI